MADHEYFRHIFFLFVVLFYGLVRVVLLWWGQLNSPRHDGLPLLLGLEEEDLKHVPTLDLRMFFVLFMTSARCSLVRRDAWHEMTWGKLREKEDLTPNWRHKKRMDNIIIDKGLVHPYYQPWQGVHCLRHGAELWII